MDLIPDFEKEIARGSERHVYLLANSDLFLAKVIKAKHLKDVARSDDTRLSSWLRLRRAYGLYRREQRAYTNAMLRAAVRGEVPPIAAIGAFVATPKGLAQLVERVTDPAGNTAPTLDDLLQDGPLPADLLKALNRFVTALYDWHIPAYDLGPKNILWDGGLGRFVLVDGFGDRAAIPVVTWWRAANNWTLDRAFEKTQARSSLIWDKHNRRFENGGTAPDTESASR